MNICQSCKLDFGSVAAFDLHRTGVHQYTFSEGLRMDPERLDGRRCLDEDEIATATDRSGALLFALNAKGQWSLRASLIDARERFQGDPEASAA